MRQRAHAEYLRQQIQELQQQRQRERAAVLEEGRRQEQEVRQRHQRLAQLRQQKLQEFRSGAAGAAFLSSLSPSWCPSGATSQLPLHPQRTGPAAGPWSQIHCESNEFFPLQSHWNSLQVLCPRGAQGSDLSQHSPFLDPSPRGTSWDSPGIWGSFSIVLGYGVKATGVTKGVFCSHLHPPAELLMVGSLTVAAQSTAIPSGCQLGVRKGKEENLRGRVCLSSQIDSA